MNRRDFLKASAALTARPAAGCVAQPMRVCSTYGSAIPEYDAGALVNDVHSQLNATRIASIVKPRTFDELRRAIVEVKAAGRSVSIAGGRHAMGGQQFGEGGVLVDTRALNHMLYALSGARPISAVPASMMNERNRSARLGP